MIHTPEMNPFLALKHLYNPELIFRFETPTILESWQQCFTCANLCCTSSYCPVTSTSPLSATGSLYVAKWTRLDPTYAARRDKFPTSALHSLLLQRAFKYALEIGFVLHFEIKFQYLRFPGSCHARPELPFEPFYIWSFLHLEIRPQDERFSV